MREDGWFVRRSIKLKRVLSESVHASGQHDPILRRAREDVAALARVVLKPVGIVKRAAAQSHDVRKSLQIEVDFGPAASTKVQRNAFAAAVRSGDRTS